MLPGDFKMKKAKDSLHGSTSCVMKRTRNALLFWLFAVVSIGFVWFFLGFFNHGTFDGQLKKKTQGFSSCQDKASTFEKYFNVSNTQILGLASVFSESDQVCFVLWIWMIKNIKSLSSQIWDFLVFIPIVITLYYH